MNASRILWALLTVSIVGCQQFNLFDRLGIGLDALRSQSPEDDEALDDEFESKIEVPLIGEYTRAAGLHVIELHGVGLVTGLDGTGGDPPPSHLRTRLLDDIRKRGIPNPNALLRSPTTALVMVRAYLPPLVDKGDRVDVVVSLPGNSDATSLEGGWLLETDLSEDALVAGRGVLKGHVFAKAKGPILLSKTEDEGESLSGGLRRGRVLGGATSLRDRQMSLYLRNDFRSFRNATRVAGRIGERFHYYNQSGIKEPLAEAKTDQKIDLKLYPKYKHNYPRFLHVVRSIAFRESAVARRIRMQKLQKELLQPHLAEHAALQLEAIGGEAVPILKEGLASPSLEVRFHSAVALAYLDEPAGLSALAESAKVQPAFRVHALAAMAALDAAETQLHLRELMSEPSAETRYGAFRALSTLDGRDPFIRGELLNGQFMLHVVDAGGDPMIHLTHRKKAEVVLFGADQQFKTPLVLRAGKNVLITGQPGSQTVSVSRYVVGEPEQRKNVSTKVADVIRTVAELGGDYPDVAQMLVEASAQQITSSPVQIDALPRAGRVYHRTENEMGGGYRTETQVGHESFAPNLFEAERGGEVSEKPTKTPAQDDDQHAGDAREQQPVHSNETTDVNRAADQGPVWWRWLAW